MDAAGQILGVAEVAELLGWPRSKVSRWLKAGRLPEPADRLRSGPVWFRTDIEAWRLGPMFQSQRSKELAAMEPMALETHVAAFAPWFEVAEALLLATDAPSETSLNHRRDGRGAQLAWCAAQSATIHAVQRLLEHPGSTRPPECATLLQRAILLLSWRGGRYRYRVHEGRLQRRCRPSGKWEDVPSLL